MKKLLFAMLIAGFASIAVAQDSLRVGDKAPDFEVGSFNNTTVKLSDRFNENGHPTILLFSRANW